MEAHVARPHRIQFPGIIYHVFSRGNEKMNIFKDDLERKYFVNLLSSLKAKCKFKLYAYVLMSNHYHLLIEPAGVLLSKIMQLLNGKYGMYFNWKHNRVGHLFQGRYGNIAVENNEYLFDAIRYIHLNPVRKRMVKTPDEYKWSSHAGYINNEASKLIDKDHILNCINKNPSKAIKEFRSFVGNADYKSSLEQAAGYIDKLVAGSREFAEDILDKAVKKNLRVPLWAFRGNRADPEDIITRTARVFEVSREELIQKRGKWNKAKKTAIYLMWKNTGLSAAEISGIFNKQHASGIKRIVGSVEKESLENEEFKSKIDFLQDSLRSVRRTDKASDIIRGDLSDGN